MIVQSALKADEDWPQDSLLVALEYVGSTDSRIVAVNQRDVRAEEPSATVVTVIREGLLDDSVRAVWFELHIAQVDGGTWRLTNSYRAYRCRRGAYLDSFGATLCP